MASKEYQKVLNGDINRKEDSINAARPTSNNYPPQILHDYDANILFTFKIIVLWNWILIK